MQYQTPVIQDFGSIAAHTFLVPAPSGSHFKNTHGPGHVDGFTECSGGSGDANYPVGCTGDGNGGFTIP